MDKKYFNMDLKDFFKDKFNINSLLIGVTVATAVILIFYPFEYSAWGIPLRLICLLTLSISGTYLLVELIKFCYKNRENKKSVAIKEESQNEKYQEYANTRCQNIWLYFNSMTEDNLSFLVGLFKKGERDSYDKNIRIIDTEHTPYVSEYQMKKHFSLKFGAEFEYSCFDEINKTNTKLIFKFEEYFYKLLENYIDTGIRKKI